MLARVERLIGAIADLDSEAARAILEEAFGSAPPLRVCDELVRPALEAVGEQWERGQLSLAHVFVSSRICERALEEHVDPAAAAQGTGRRIAIGVFSDRHQLGKRMVLSSLRASGYRVLDYGAGLEKAALLRRVEEDRLEVLLLSTLMLRSALGIAPFIAELRRSRLATKVVVGGAPFRLDPQLAAEVGADAWGATASDALEIVARLCAGGTP
jgi:methanogenic corrinoid protein MtbC1